ncbi:MAG: protein-disulfide reductase DsbD domain-containing protein [Opitutaceae bacterium]
MSASLVAQEGSIHPGHSLLVALRLVHEPHWHTYWKNPGVGLPTALKWKLPEGFKAGEIQWPAPMPIRDATGALTGNGYDGETLLLVEITPPSSLPTGSKAILSASATWLMCKETCVPGGAEVSLTLPVSEAAPIADPVWGARIQREQHALPQVPSGWKLSAGLSQKNIILDLIPTRQEGGSGSEGGNDIRFFSDDDTVPFDAPQRVEAIDAGGFRITLATASDASAPAPSRLQGVLVRKAGWGGGIRGIAVDIPLETGVSSQAGQGDMRAKTGAIAPPASLLGTLGLAFIGGLILNLMPCVFPVLGIKILGFVRQAGSERRKVVSHGLAFTAGVLLSFWVLAGLLTLLRAGGSQLGWGFQLQSPVFVFVLAAGLLVFGLNMSGVFEFGLGATGFGASLQGKSGYSGSFFTGVLATIVATPCSAPFLAPALGAALALSALQSFAIFTAIAVGLSMPYLLLSLFPSAVKVLPRPGAWMETFKQFMAFPLYATVGYLVWVLAGQVNEGALLNVFFGLVLVAMGTWVYGRWAAPGRKPVEARLGLVCGLLLMALGAFAGWPRAAKPTDIAWEPWSPARVQQLRGEGRVIYVDFTARWCATCQANKKLVFGSEKVRELFHRKNVAALRGDWTNSNPAITAELARWNRSAVPFNLIYLPDKSLPVLLPEILTADFVLRSLE